MSAAEAEQLTHNPKMKGSNPATGTNRDPSALREKKMKKICFVHKLYLYLWCHSLN